MELECVFVLKRSAFRGALALPSGYAPLDATQRMQLLALCTEQGFFVERRAAEEDPDLKQLIPYCVVHNDESVLCVRRLKQSSEGRLHGSWSIGIGGHIEPQDRLPTRQGSVLAHNVSAADVDPTSHHDVGALSQHIVARAARRELQEELVLSSPSDAQFLGWINDDSNPVGQVHLGLVHLLNLGDAKVSIREEDRLEGGLVPHAALLALRAQDRPKSDPLAQRDHASIARNTSELRSFSPSLQPSASLGDPVPRDWSSIESWSRFVLEAVRPRNRTFSLS